MVKIVITTTRSNLGNILQDFATVTVNNSSVMKVSFDFRLATVIKEGLAVKANHNFQEDSVVVVVVAKKKVCYLHLSVLEIMEKKKDYILVRCFC